MKNLSVMKKIFLLIAMAFGLLSAQAQFGIKAGLNMATWRGDDVESDDKKSKLGIYGGVFYNHKLSSNFSLQPELVYSAQGVKFEEGDNKAVYKLNYINLTPLVRWNSSSGFFVGVGPQVGFLMSANYEENDEDGEDIKDLFKGIDFAGVVALGFETKKGIGAYARFNLGLSNIIDEDDADVKNSVFQVGLRFNFGAMKDGGDPKDE
jgi:hypothetical protein